MKKSTLISVLASLIVGSHAVFFFWIILNRASFNQEEFAATLGIVVPLFGAYVTAVVQYYLSNPTGGGPDVQLTRGFANVTLILTTALIGFVFLVVTLQLRGNVFRDAKDYIAALALAETAFGVHAGKLIQSMFGLSRA
jgi:hypothetical protein